MQHTMYVWYWNSFKDRECLHKNSTKDTQFVWHWWSLCYFLFFLSCLISSILCGDCIACSCLWASTFTVFTLNQLFTIYTKWNAISFIVPIYHANSIHFILSLSFSCLHKQVASDYCGRFVGFGSFSRRQRYIREFHLKNEKKSKMRSAVRQEYGKNQHMYHGVAFWQHLVVIKTIIYFSTWILNLNECIE